MEIRNLNYHEGVPFEDYLKMPGYSYSGLKSAGGVKMPDKPTAQMELGTAVHNYLLEPEKFAHTDPDAKALAWELRPLIAPLLPYAKCELAVTCDMVHEGFVMPYKGRLDLGVPGRLVVDLKVTKVDIRSAIDFFGYHNQISGYCLVIGAPLGFIAAVNSKTKKPYVVPIKVVEDFWIHKIKIYGFPE